MTVKPINLEALAAQYPRVAAVLREEIRRLEHIEERGLPDMGGKYIAGANPLADALMDSLKKSRAISQQRDDELRLELGCMPAVRSTEKSRCQANRLAKVRIRTKYPELRRVAPVVNLALLVAGRVL